MPTCAEGLGSRVRLIRRRLLVAALCLLFVTASRSAPGQLSGPEFQANTYTTGDQWRPSVAADTAGNFVMIWRSDNQDGDIEGVFGQRFDFSGVPVGTEFQVNSYTTGAQYGSAVASDGSGNFLVVWNNRIQNVPVYAVARRFDALGVPAGDEFRLSAYTTESETNPAVAADGLGNFILVWSASDASTVGVFGRRFAGSGSPLGGEFQVNTYTTSAQGHPIVAADAAGDFVVVWNSYGQDGASYGVFGQRYDSSGDPAGGEFQVNSYTTWWQVATSVAMNGAGAFVVTWMSQLQDGSESGVFARRYSPAGVAQGDEFQVNSYTTGLQLGASVAVGDSGEFVVAWQTFDYPAQFDSDIVAQRYDAAGVQEGSTFRVNSYTTAFQGYPAISATPSGTFVVAWGGPGDVTRSEVHGQRLAAVVFADGFAEGTICGWSASQGSGDACPP